MSPTLAEVPAGIAVAALCRASARHGSFGPEQARLALGAISNMYCLYALDHGLEGSTTTMRALSADRIADPHAVLVEIRRAVPRADQRMAESILAGLSRALDSAFLDRGLRRAVLPGFGLLEPVELERSEYRLTIELPLARYLSHPTPGQLE